MSSFATSSVIQSFLLREKRRVFVAPVAAPETAVPHGLTAAVLADIGQLGFTLDGETVARLQAMGVGDLKAFHLGLVQVLRGAVGANVQYQPLFKNFPRDVPDSREYLVRRFIGYIESVLGLASSDYSVLSCGHVINQRLFDLAKFGACPVCQHQVPELCTESAAAFPLDELTPLKVLRLAADEDVWVAFDNVLRSRSSLSESYKGFVTAVVTADAQEAARRLPLEMPFKETATFVVATLLKLDVAAELLVRFLKTPTDVLRLAVALCDGDVSLKEVTRFKLRNAHRQFLMRAFNELAQTQEHLLEEMLGYRGRWLRLGEVLHVGQFQRRFPKAHACFDALRNREESITTHASRVEQLLVRSDLQTKAVRAQLLSALSARPGELARKLDALLQRGLPAGEVLGAFKEVMSNVSTTILLTLLAHFRQRAKPAAFRAFMPKGSVSKMYVVEGDARLPLDLQARMGILELVDVELRRRFAEREALGKVFVSEELEAVLVPFSQRSASTGLSPLTRGSRIAVDPTKDFVRLFMHWAEAPGTGTIDVDLTCGLYDDSWNKLDHLSWTNARSMGRSAHSGDVRSASNPEGAAEFIDLDIAALKRAGVRYATVTVFSWTGQTFDTFPCFAGFMERDEPGNGKHFEAKTVKHKFEVTGSHVIMVPMVLDVHTLQVVWADLSLKGRGGYNAIESVGDRVVSQLKAVIALQDQRISLKELFELHGRARGELVTTRADADVVFDEGSINALDEVVADWL